MDATGITIGEIVAGNYRTADIFERYGIDFCCGGNVPLETACLQAGVDLAAITRELEVLQKEPSEQDHNYAAWDVSFLADYIVNIHHAYLKETTGQIASYAHKIAEVHGPRHPEVIRIATLFDQIATDMAAHLQEEETSFFPAIKRVAAKRTAGSLPDAEDLALIAASIRKLGHEHEQVGDAIHAIRQLAHGFEAPGDACNTFRLTYQKLKEFEADLHKHVHLENNLLFPKAAQL